MASVHARCSSPPPHLPIPPVTVTAARDGISGGVTRIPGYGGHSTVLQCSRCRTLLSTLQETSCCGFSSLDDPRHARKKAMEVSLSLRLTTPSERKGWMATEN
jgi:hypothetical protein